MCECITPKQHNQPGQGSCYLTCPSLHHFGILYLVLFFFLKNVTQSIYSAFLLFEVWRLPAEHTIRTRNGGKIKEAIFHFVLVWKIQKTEISPTDILQAYYFRIFWSICLSAALRCGTASKSNLTVRALNRNVLAALVTCCIRAGVVLFPCNVRSWYWYQSFRTSYTHTPHCVSSGRIRGNFSDMQNVSAWQQVSYLFTKHSSGV